MNRLGSTETECLCADITQRTWIAPVRLDTAILHVELQRLLTNCMSVTQTWLCSISSRRRRRSSPSVAGDETTYRSDGSSASAWPLVRLGLPPPSCPSIDLIARRRRPPALPVKTPIGTQPTAAAHDVDSFMPASFVHQPSTSTAGWRPTDDPLVLNDTQTFVYTPVHSALYCHEQQPPLIHCPFSLSYQPYQRLTHTWFRPLIMHSVYTV